MKSIGSGKKTGLIFFFIFFILPSVAAAAIRSPTPIPPTPTPEIVKIEVKACGIEYEFYEGCKSYDVDRCTSAPILRIYPENEDPYINIFSSKEEPAYGFKSLCPDHYKLKIGYIHWSWDRTDYTWVEEKRIFITGSGGITIAANKTNFVGNDQIILKASSLADGCSIWQDPTFHWSISQPSTFHHNIGTTSSLNQEITCSLPKSEQNEGEFYIGVSTILQDCNNYGTYSRKTFTWHRPTPTVTSTPTATPTPGCNLTVRVRGDYPEINEKLEGAEVTIINTSNNNTITKETDENGETVFNQIPFGDYVIMASSSCYTTSGIEFAANKGNYLRTINLTANKIVVDGYVYDNNANPIGDAVVNFASSKGSKTTRTDEFGYYIMEEIEPVWEGGSKIIAGLPGSNFRKRQRIFADNELSPCEGVIRTDIVLRKETNFVDNPDDSCH
ncbi:MAG: MSCRAMM family protein, partial [bacterium]